MEKLSTYKDAGVNIEDGDEASRILFEAAKKTWENRIGKIGEIIAPSKLFSGIRYINVANLPEGSLMCLGFDGVGTKVEIAERISNHKTVAFDLFAMVCDDATVRGGEPILIGSVLDVNKVDIKIVRQLAEGYVNAARDAGVAVINGELAELGYRVSGYGAHNYNWSASIVWFAREDRIFTGKEIKVGDSIVAFKEDGFRSNGLSLARKILLQQYGDYWHKQKLDGKNIAELLLTPSKIYCKAVTEMTGGFSGEERAKLHGVVHITGGGIPGKLGRVLNPLGFGALIEDPFTPSELMSHLIEIGNVPMEEAKKTWNLGNGMLVITPDPENVIKIAKENNIEAKNCGHIIKKNIITISHDGRVI